MFATKCKMPKRRQQRGTALSFERCEDRSMMSAAPAATTAAAPQPVDPDRDYENFVYGIVYDLRQDMQGGMLETAAAAGSQGLGTTPFATVIKGNLVVVGTNGVDNMKVQQYPAATNQQGAVVRPAYYHVTVSYVANRRSYEKTWDFHAGLVTSNRVYMYGLGDKDNLSFTALTPTSTSLRADGGAGVDTITGGPNADFLDGGAEDTSKDTIYGAGGDDVIAGGGGDDLLFGDAGRDLLWGEAGKDTMRGGADNDELFGGADNDTLYGDSGDDKLYGGVGKDTLNGEMGADYLNGGVGDGQADILDGGTQGDAFVIDGTSAANNKDKPRRFDANEGDSYAPIKQAQALTASNVMIMSLDAGFADLGARSSTKLVKRA
jgi:Ca2+-binding RTX toxin-like protein